jgi:hypothetical protein
VRQNATNAARKEPTNKMVEAAPTRVRLFLLLGSSSGTVHFVFLMNMGLFLTLLGAPSGVQDQSRSEAQEAAEAIRYCGKGEPIRMHEAALTALMSANFRPVPFSEVTSNPGNDTDDDDSDEQPDPRCKRRRVALTALEISRISESPTLHWGHQCFDSGRGKPDWTLFSWDDFVPLVFADLGATSKKEQLRAYAVNALRLDCGVRYETGNNPAVLCIELNFGPLNGLLTGIKLYGYCVFKTERPSAGAPPESPIGEILLFESGTSDVEASLARVFHAALRHGAARGYSKCPFVLDSHKPTVARNKPTMYKT